MLRKFKYILFFTVVFYACSRHVVYQGFYDPAYNLKSKKICFLPCYGTKCDEENDVNQLMEKTIYYHFKSELEKRGLQTEYISSENLIYDREKDAVSIKETAANYCDCSLNIRYTQNIEAITRPVQLTSNLWFDDTGDWNSGAYLSPYDAFFYNLHISGSIFAEGKEIWQGSIAKESPSANLDEQAAKMVKGLFKEKFPKIK
jgi:hypothetical protein